MLGSALCVGSVHAIWVVQGGGLCVRREVGVEDPRKAQEQWAVSSPVLLALLVRWSTKLKKEAPASARKLLQECLTGVMESGSFVWLAQWQFEGCFSPKKVQDGPKATVRMQAGHLIMDPLMEELPWLALQPFQAIWLPNSPLGSYVAPLLSFIWRLAICPPCLHTPALGG